MTLTSFSFLVFLLCVVTIYYLVPKKHQWIVLLTASYGFYLSGGVGHVFYLMGTTAISYSAALMMQKLRDQFQEKIGTLGPEVTRVEKREMKKQVSKRIHTIQVVTVLVNLAVLACVKYLDFFIESFNALFAWDVSMPFLNLLVPLGVSYYTFNSIGYLVDVGRGKIQAEKNLGKFALFVSFFPSIVQGPLFRYGDVGVQLQQPHKLEYNNLKFGAQLMLWGFFKKLVVADRVAVISNTVFGSGFESYSGHYIFFGVLAYSLQIYCDFSGGTDITRGVAQMMGIQLPENFARPLFATSMADFWRRWHMSLGAWMREFVFYPVMLSKPVTAVSKMFRKRFGSYAGKIVPSVAAPLVVFFLMNIWHGLSTQRIINGLYNALIISSSVALAPVYKKMTEKLRVNTETFSYKLFQMLRTFALLCVSRILTHAPSLEAAGKMLVELVKDRVFLTSQGIDFFLGYGEEIFTFGLNQREMLLLFLCVLVMLVVDILQEMGIQIRQTLAKQNLIFRWGVILILLVSVLVFGVYGPSYDAKAFIYGGF